MLAVGARHTKVRLRLFDPRSAVVNLSRFPLALRTELIYALSWCRNRRNSELIRLGSVLRVS